jgi:chloramphenicol-sensitive protein RarD
MKTLQPGYLFAASSYGIWGFLPLYWRLLHVVPPLGIISYRIGFSFVTVWILVGLRRFYGAWKKKGLVTPITSNLSWTTFQSLALPTLLAAVLIAINWFVYIFAIINSQTLDASLGYFLTPLVNVLLGILLLKEKPGMLRLLAIGLGFFAVVILTIHLGQVPVIALVLAGSFGLYGFLKKGSTLDSLSSMAIETTWVLPIALYLLFAMGNITYLIDYSPSLSLLLIGAGPMTLAPLVLFAAATKRIPLYILGFFQYLAPSIMFLLGWLVFGEPVSIVQFIAFGFVWVALLIVTLSVFQQRGFVGTNMTENQRWIRRN